ncbi:MAG: hypothetical protein K5669_10705 [Lachnospiraceae bacterium]|nr:hypothetical protein [Lachnospiraceae bacterium]
MDKASVESQLGIAMCEAQDTEEMFWLRQNDDLQSQMLLGQKLVSAYRYKEAAAVWENAAARFDVGADLYLKLGGAYLTVRSFDNAKKAYEKYLVMGGDEKSYSYPMGIWHYLKGEYKTAAELFEKCVPCDGEMMIALIYWHCLSLLRAEISSGEVDHIRNLRTNESKFRELPFLKYYTKDLDVGHHTAYKNAVALIAGEKDLSKALEELEKEDDDLNYCIYAYGVYVYLKVKESSNSSKTNGLPSASSGEFLKKILKRNKMWPCISYIAAWNDKLCQ